MSSSNFFEGVTSRDSNNGWYERCDLCGVLGHTAHDLTWDALLVGWVCYECRQEAQDSIPADVRFAGPA